jgi:outer membrane protein OmpA-like peptidoglycan-associated protein
MRRSKLIVSLSIVVSVALAGCATDEYGNRRPLTDAEKGVLIGGIGGAVIGSATSSKKHRTRGAVLGAVGGGLAGGMVGNYMDNQKKDFEKVLAAERNAGAIQIEKAANNALRVTMSNQTAFEIDSAGIKGGFHSSMNKIATIVNRYGKTQLTVVGHTDSSGSDAHNQRLSDERARAVHSYLEQKGVAPQRLASYGLGESEPRASNDTAAGRQLNRRAEIIIEPVVATASR